jgi:YYY domain-containing protein
MEYGVVVRWWLFFQVLLVAGLPLSSRLLPEAPDRGASVAMPLSLVAVTLVTLWVGQVAFGPVAVAGVFVAFLAASAWLARGGVDVPRRPLLEVVAVFTVAFGFLIAVRVAADGVHPYGGEKFLDMGLVQSLLRGSRLPPQDMWFAGERVVYYYGGHLMTAVGAHLTATEGRLAYSPALAGFYAMAVTAAYGLAGTLAAALGSDDGDSRSDTGDDDRVGGRISPSTALGAAGIVFVAVLLATGVDWVLLALPAAGAVLAVTRSRRVRAGVLAAFVYGFASNLGTPVRLLAARVDLVRDAVAAAGISSNRQPAITPSEFDAWHGSRFVETGINEFPLFAYLNGDLHAHMMSVPVLFLAVAVGLAYYRTPTERRGRRLALLFGGFPVAAAAILAVNTWSFPTVLGVAALSVALADPAPGTLLPARARPWADRGSTVGKEVQRVLLAVVAAAVVAALALVVAWPFVRDVLLSGASNQHPAAFPDPSLLGAFLFVHGLFLVAFAAYLVSRVADSAAGWLAAGLAALGLVGVAYAVDPVVAGVRVGVVAVLLAGPLLAGAWALRRRAGVGFEGVLVVAGAGLVVLVEYVYLADAASFERFNTIFKVYAQVWALWAIPAGVALAALASRVPSASRARSVGGTLLVVALVVSTSIYGGLALSAHFGSADGEATIDAFEYVHEERPGEAAAIEWLHEKPGQPHIVSAPGTTPYSWQNPASSLTGIPTVAGWVHEANYHSQSAWDQRVSDVGIVYETTDEASRAALLRKHDVEYIWVGPVERERYDVARMGDEPGISTPYATPTVVVYQVNQSALTDVQPGT